MIMPDTLNDHLSRIIINDAFPFLGANPSRENLLPGTALCHFFRGLDRTGRICMGWQFVTMGIGVGGMSWRKGRFRDCLMLLVRQGIFHGMMTGVIEVSITIHARPGFHCFFPHVLFWRCLSGRHTQ